MERDTLEAAGALEAAGRLWGEYGTDRHVDLATIARDAATAENGAE